MLQNRQFCCFCGVSPISAALEDGNPGNPRGLGNGLWKRSGYRYTRGLGDGLRKRSGYCKIDNFGAFVVCHSFLRPWKQEIQEIQGALDMASGTGAGIAKSTILVLLWYSTISAAWEARNPRKQRALEMATGKRAEPWKWLPQKERGLRQRSGNCKIGNFGALAGFPLFRRSWKPEIKVEK